MPLPTQSEAETLGLKRVVPTGHCASCGMRPAAEGWLMCHECREAAGLTYQPKLFDDKVSIDRFYLKQAIKASPFGVTHISEAMGHERTWLGHRIAYGYLAPRDLSLLCSILGIEERGVSK